MRDVLDSHTHTIASGHAYSTMHEMAAAAAEKGLELFGNYGSRYGYARYLP